MVEGISSYVVSILVAVISCSILTSFVAGNTVGSGLIRMLCGIYIAITVVAPLLKIRLNDIGIYWSNIQGTADVVAQEGRDAAIDESSLYIKEDLQTYILKKADELGASIDVELNLSDEFPPTPQCIEISGTVSPYNK